MLAFIKRVDEKVRKDYLGRLGRLDFLILSIIGHTAVFALLPRLDAYEAWTLPFVFYMAILLVVSISNGNCISYRLQDMDRHPLSFWLFLPLSLIHPSFFVVIYIVGMLYLTLKPGTPGLNKYDRLPT